MDLEQLKDDVQQGRTACGGWRMGRRCSWRTKSIAAPRINSARFPVCSAVGNSWCTPPGGSRLSYRRMDSLTRRLRWPRRRQVANSSHELVARRTTAVFETCRKWTDFSERAGGFAINCNLLRSHRPRRSSGARQSASVAPDAPKRMSLRAPVTSNARATSPCHLVDGATGRR